MTTPPKTWGKLPDLFIEWKQAAEGHREKRFSKYIDDLVRLKEIDIQKRGEGIALEFYWRRHQPDLFDAATQSDPAKREKAPESTTRRRRAYQPDLFTRK